MAASMDFVARGTPLCRRDARVVRSIRPAGAQGRPGRTPSSYLAAYPDVQAAHVNPLAHFLQYGIHEGRQAFADGHFG